MNSEEPKILVKGKQFHKEIQKDWTDNAEGDVFPEKHVKMSNDKNGRMDIFVQADESYVVVGEIKNSDWDSMTPIALRRNVRRQIRQVWKYIDTQLAKGNDVTPGIIFPKRPQKIETMNKIEKKFEEEDIPVVWEDESKEERKSRS
jgi:hypothetical protein